jgi:hypothetical protein
MGHASTLGKSRSLPKISFSLARIVEIDVVFGVLNVFAAPQAVTKIDRVLEMRTEKQKAQ